jgi:hypothetical protein
MPRLSLYKPERGQDYKFMDRQISEMFQVGGTDVYLHKYLGPKIATEGTADQPIYDAVKETNIQDLLFLENRDRKYSEEIYRIRGIYNVQNIDFNLSQFGLFIDNDTIYMTVHINDFVNYIGRKPLSGDVLELPHLRDNFALNEYEIGLPRYYVIEDVGRASEGFSATWYPHLYRLRLKKITDAQQFADILDKPAIDANGNPIDKTLRDILSTRGAELQINDAVILQAEADSPKSGYETRQFYTLAVDEQGKTTLNTSDTDTLDASITSITALESNKRPVRTGYTGFLVGDGFPQNGYDFGHGIQFPETAGPDDFFLRTDFMPNRLFRFDGARWIKVEDAVRMNMTNNDTRQTHTTGFINNTTYIYNEAVGIDWLKLPPPIIPPATSIPVNYNYVFDTPIDYQESLYVVFKLETVEIVYVVEENSGIISNNAGKVRITLPEFSDGYFTVGKSYKITSLGNTDFTLLGATSNTVGTTFVATNSGNINNTGTASEFLPYDGLWKLSLCNNREAQRQSLSKALRPKADL